MFLLLLVNILIRIPAVQNFVSGKATNYLEEKTGAEIKLDKLLISFPKAILIKGLYVGDVSKDTLLSAGKIEVDIAIWGLLRNKIHIDEFSLNNTTIKLKRSLADSTFNFQYILDSLSGNGESNPPPDTAKSEGMDFSLGSVRLQQIRFLYDDEVSGMEIRSGIGRFALDMQDINLDSLVFEIDGIDLENSFAHIRIMKESEDESEESAQLPEIRLQTANLANIDFSLENQPTGSMMELNLGVFTVDAKETSLRRQIIDLKSIGLQKTAFSYSFRQEDTETTAQTENDTEQEEPAAPWNISADNILIKTLDFAFKNTALPRAENQVDFQHLNISSLDLEAADINYAGMDISADIDHLSFYEQSGFELRELRTKVQLTEHRAELDALYLETGHSVIINHIALEYPLLSDIGDNLADLYVDIQLQGSRVAHEDLAIFSPVLLQELPLKTRNLKPVRLDAQIRGLIADLDVNELNIALQQNTAMKIHGAVKGLPVMDSVQVDLFIDEIRTGRQDIFTLLSDTLIPDGIQIPRNISLQGELKGNPAMFDATTKLQSSFGNLLANIRMQDITGDLPKYRGSIESDTIQLGILMKDTAMFGPVKIKAGFNGSGFKPEKMNSRADLEISFAELNNYVYHNMNFEVSARQNKYTASGSVQDEYVEFIMDGKYAAATGRPEIDLVLNLKAANLQQLNLAEEDIRVRGKLTADLEGEQIDNINGELRTKNVLIIKNGKPYPIDSLVFIAFNDTDSTSLEIESSILDANFGGNLKVSELAGSLKDHFNNYFFYGDTTKTNRIRQQSFAFIINLKSTTFLKDVLLPGLETLETGKIRGSFNGKKEILRVDVDIPLIIYQGNEVNDLSLSIRSDPQKFHSDFSIARMKLMGLRFDSLQLRSEARNDSLYNRLTVKDEKGQLKYRIAASLTSIDTAYRLSFLQDKILLNHNEWNVPPENYVLLGGFSPSFKNIRFSHRDQSIALQKNENEFLVEMNNFMLSNLTGLLETSTGAPVLGGKVNGEIKTRQQEKNSFINADLRIDSTKVMGAYFGSTSIIVRQDSPEMLTANMNISDRNIIQLDINKLPFNPNEKADISLDLDVLHLETLSPLIGNIADSLDGKIQGNLEIASKLSDPQVFGKLHFREVSAVINSIGNKLTIPKDQIEIRENDLTFEGFTIRDRDQNAMEINGTVKTDSLNLFMLDLKLTADKFTAIDKQQADDGIFFGRLTFSTDTDIQGSVREPKIRSNTTIEDDTDFRISIQKARPSQVEAAGIVEFVDKDRNINEILIDEEDEDVAFKASGIELNASIQTDEEATFQLIIDEKAGDKLSIRGSSELTFNLNEAGQPSLTGRYNLTGGEYRLTLFDISRREFMIRDDSYILWTGQPLGGTLHINAEYNVRAAPLNLINAQSSNATQAEMDRYKQKLPFIVNLIIRGDLMAPDINFSIELPPDKRNVLNGTVQAKLQQLNQPGNQSNLNKQVLSLLAFNQFMPQNPMDLGGGGGLSTAARSSVSKLLSRQLNQFASKYIKGVNLSFDVKSYEEYSAEGAPEGRTELGVGLSKSFLDNRLEVKVGGNVELESREYREQTQLNDIAGDIILVYKLTENGIWRAKAFRLSEYEQFEGSITESGASLIFTRSFNYLGDIFKKPDKNKERSKKEKK